MNTIPLYIRIVLLQLKQTDRKYEYREEEYYYIKISIIKIII